MAHISTTLTERLRYDPPAVHGAGDEYWGLAWPALEWLEGELREGMATLETGSGASTIVFAGAGTEHVAITPDPDEETRIRRACDALGVPSERSATAPWSCASSRTSFRRSTGRARGSAAA